MKLKWIFPPFFLLLLTIPTDTLEARSVGAAKVPQELQELRERQQGVLNKMNQKLEDIEKFHPEYIESNQAAYDKMKASTSHLEKSVESLDQGDVKQAFVAQTQFMSDMAHVMNEGINFMKRSEEEKTPPVGTFLKKEGSSVRFPKEKRKDVSEKPFYDAKKFEKEKEVVSHTTKESEPMATDQKSHMDATQEGEAKKFNSQIKQEIERTASSGESGGAEGDGGPSGSDAAEGAHSTATALKAGGGGDDVGGQGTGALDAAGGAGGGSDAAEGGGGGDGGAGGPAGGAVEKTPLPWLTGEAGGSSDGGGADQSNSGGGDLLEISKKSDLEELPQSGEGGLDPGDGQEQGTSANTQPGDGLSPAGDGQVNETTSGEGQTAGSSGNESGDGLSEGNGGSLTSGEGELPSGEGNSLTAGDGSKIGQGDDGQTAGDGQLPHAEGEGLTVGDGLAKGPSGDRSSAQATSPESFSSTQTGEGSGSGAGGGGNSTSGDGEAQGSDVIEAPSGTDEDLSGRIYKTGGAGPSGADLAASASSALLSGDGEIEGGNAAAGQGAGAGDGQSQADSASAGSGSGDGSTAGVGDSQGNNQKQNKNDGMTQGTNASAGLGEGEGKGSGPETKSADGSGAGTGNSSAEGSGAGVGDGMSHGQTSGDGLGAGAASGDGQSKTTSSPDGEGNANGNEAGSGDGEGRANGDGSASGNGETQAKEATSGLQSGSDAGDGSGQGVGKTEGQGDAVGSGDAQGLADGLKSGTASSEDAGTGSGEGPTSGEAAGEGSGESDADGQTSSQDQLKELENQQQTQSGNEKDQKLNPQTPNLSDFQTSDLVQDDLEEEATAANDLEGLSSNEERELKKKVKDQNIENEMLEQTEIVSDIKEWLLQERLLIQELKKFKPVKQPNNPNPPWEYYVLRQKQTLTQLKQVRRRIEYLGTLDDFLIELTKLSKVGNRMLDLLNRGEYTNYKAAAKAYDDLLFDLESVNKNVETLERKMIEYRLESNEQIPGAYRSSVSRYFRSLSEI